MRAILLATPALAAMFAISACVPSDHLARARAPAPEFDPVRFFAGHSEGRGSLKVALRAHTPTLVDGNGIATPDGGIDLVQSVRLGDGKPTRRTWHLRRVATGRYTGTLSDARGPVTGEVHGNCLHLRFAMKGGLRAQQWLYLEPGGQAAVNRMVVTKFGLPVASLDEKIVRLPT
ncbi:DUF3833 family protein [Sphingomonas sp. RB3P16]|uniref:DUF3833 family protein n=1 Tax=Parasphingomonas frigoris TaxID=3096163 RepID=UPI002FCC3EE8